MIRTSLLLLWGLIFPSVLLAELPKYSNDFLTIGVGARAFGMSGSVVASTKDVTAGYWNPGGLAGSEWDADIGLMHSEYFAGQSNYDYAGFSIRIDERSTGAVSVIRLGIDDIPNTLELIDENGELRYDLISTFSAADYGFLFSYARSSGIEGLSFGGNAKLIYRRVGDFANAWGFGFDVAGHYRLNQWEFGAVARDASTTFNAWFYNTSDLEEVFASTGNEIPENSLELTVPSIVLGASRSFRLHERFNLLAEMDAGISLDGKRNSLLRAAFIGIDPRIGLEADYQRLVFLRLGLGDMYWIPDFDGGETFNFQPSLGLGIHWKNFTVDYALTDIADRSAALYANIFSLRYSFHLPSSRETD